MSKWHIFQPNGPPCRKQKRANLPTNSPATNFQSFQIIAPKSMPRSRRRGRDQVRESVRPLLRCSDLRPRLKAISWLSERCFLSLFRCNLGCLHCGPLGWMDGIETGSAAHAMNLKICKRVQDCSTFILIIGLLM